MTPHDRPADIRISVAMIINTHGEMLTVRKRGTTAFMQPGGKINADETPLAALMRELNEELALTCSPEQFRYEGTYREWAVNEPGMIVEAETFSWLADPDVVPQAEIEETKWLPIEGQITIKRAPLSENHLFPIARQRFAESRSTQ